MTNVLEFPLEQFTMLPSNGWLKEDEARLLWDAAAMTEGGILEVGCYQGRSTCLLALLGKPVTSVDPFDGFDSGDPTGETTYTAFVLHLRERGITNVAVHQMRVEDWASDASILKPSFGFAYLDGDHTFEGTVRQIQVAESLGIKHLCLHDYDRFGGGREIKRAVESFPLDLIHVSGRMAHCKFKER